MPENVLFPIHEVGKQQQNWLTIAREFLANEVNVYPSFRKQPDPMKDKRAFMEIFCNDDFDCTSEDDLYVLARIDLHKYRKGKDGLKSSLQEWLGKRATAGTRV